MFKEELPHGYNLDDVFYHEEAQQSNAGKVQSMGHLVEKVLLLVFNVRVHKGLLSSTPSVVIIMRRGGCRGRAVVVAVAIVDIHVVTVGIMVNIIIIVFADVQYINVLRIVMWIVGVLHIM